MKYDQFFLSYSGVALPLNLVSEITPDGVENRNTYFGACVDDAGRLTLIHKVVYGEVEMSHRYEYAPEGWLKRAEIINADDEGRRLLFDAEGKIVSQEDFDVVD